ncbi:uncharacterized protein LOC134270682, partial [Saccostrea cucullata]|uniref:uncharacterized protein LOC134270682 n=1 Tax=Saccostrea cuccullata TaxID=36930 RepID=UPI002ED46266
MESTVDSCPRNLADTVRASSRLGCGRDKYGNNQYICLPNREKTKLVELCHNGVMVLIERGKCLETAEGKLFTSNCSGFLTGCPDIDFNSMDIYKYPACHGINKQFHCYLADPSCANTTWTMSTENTTEIFLPGITTDLGIHNTSATNFQTTAYRNSTWTIHVSTENTTETFPPGIPTDLGIHNTSATNFQTTANPENSSIHKWAIFGSLGAVAVTLFLIFVLIKVRMVLKTRQRLKNQEEDFLYEGINLLPTEEENFQDKRYVGEYNLWRTKISGRFSTLTDDEVLVLFCFLCSDSGPPYFTDAEWLDMLNKIRQKVYRKENPVTREEAQQTLERLKSCDYFWEDQDRITKDTKDESMYRIASINNYIPLWYSSYDTASVYLRTQRYKRKLGEKCVIIGFDDLLILRLQMNILTHVTMDDTTIYKNIHQIMNVSDNILRESEDELKEFLMDLRREGEAVHYRRRSHDSVDHVTWLWRYGRPDIVRSCIGLNPHWDIYIIDNKAYRKS